MHIWVGRTLKLKACKPLTKLSLRLAAALEYLIFESKREGHGSYMSQLRPALIVSCPCLHDCTHREALPLLLRLLEGWRRPPF